MRASKPKWDFSRTVTSMRLMAELAVDHGVALSKMLSGTGVLERQLSDSRLIVTGQQELRLVRNLVERLGGVNALGILAGERYHFTAFGALGLAFVSSSTARSALQVALQYFDLTFAFTRFAVSDAAGEIRVRIDDLDIPKDVMAFLVERDVTILVRVLREMLQFEPLLLRVSLRAPRPVDTAAYQRFFRVLPQFGAPANLAILDRSRMDQPLAHANQLALQAAVDQCRHLLESRQARSGLAASVRDQLMRHPARMPSMEAVAASHYVTLRTLRRRLLGEGTHFLELRDEVRQVLAEEFLLEPHLSIEQVAERLGYAEATSFINAFKRWRGQTPLQFRRAGRDGPGRR